jgi:hypothetical protein
LASNIDDDGEQCVHEWHNPHAGNDPEDISCQHCGIRKLHKFLVVDPAGNVTVIDDPEDEHAQDELIHRMIGDITDHRRIEDVAWAIVHDTGHFVGLKMQRKRLLRGLASVVLLGIDTEKEFRGFDVLERSVVEDMLEGAGLMSEQEAEQHRAAFDSEPF